MPLLTRDHPDYHMGHLFMECLKKRPNAICQIDAATGEQETNESVLRRSVQLARCLRKLGLRPGDVLVLGGRNHLDIHIPYYAALMNGLPIAGVDPFYKYDEIKKHFKVSRPVIAFCEMDHYEDFKNAAKALHLDTLVFTFDGENSMMDLIEKYDDDSPIDDFEPAIFDLDKVYAWLVSSGGTSGVIKLVAFTHKVWLTRVLDFMCNLFPRHDFDPDRKEAIGINLSPVHWTSGFYNALGMMINNQIKLQSSAPNTAEHVIDIINKYRPVTGMFPPSVLAAILRHEKKCDFTCFDALPIAGAKVYKYALIEIRKLTKNPKVAFEAYGQSENIGPIFLPNPTGPLGNCGKRIPSVLVKVFRENLLLLSFRRDGNILPIRLVDPETGREITEPNTPGELWTKAPCFSEYYNDPEETAKAFSEDGYYKTGDILYRDEEDNFFFVERLKMLIKFGNYQISPPELEEVILTHPGVSDVSVTSVPHEVDGEWPVACVVKAPGATVTSQEIEDLVAEKLSDSKRLRGGVIFMDVLPMTSVGKVARAKLRKMVIEIKNKN